jgi:hypothetical protein
MAEKVRVNANNGMNYKLKPAGVNSTNASVNKVQMYNKLGRLSVGGLQTGYA